MNNPKNLQEILDSSGTIDLDALLRDIVNYGIQYLGCSSGSAFLLEGATARLEMKWFSGKEWTYPFSLSKGEGVAGKAYLCLDEPSMFSGEKLDDNYLVLHDPPSSKPQGIVAMPVVMSGRAEAVFCFDYRRFLLDSSGAQNGFSNDELKKVAKLWDEFKKPEPGRCIHRVRMHGIPNKLREAGQSILDLTSEVRLFITGLLEAFQAEFSAVPKLIYVTLVDHSRQLVRTIQGVADHNRLPVTSVHSLIRDKNKLLDIIADIIIDPKIDIIAGYDPTRFDKEVFDKYEHKKYVRMWMPLFPFPLARLVIEQKNKNTKSAIESIMEWKDEKCGTDGLKILRGEWIPGEKPPRELIYGCLELGYHKDEQGSLSPWTPDHAMWTMAKAYELSQKMYRSTLPGVIERVGRLLADGPVPCRTRFVCEYPNRVRRESRQYPMPWQWPSALPKSEDVSMACKGETCYKGKLLTVEHVMDGRESWALQTPLSIDYDRSIWEQNTKVANESLNTAFTLHDSIVRDFDLIEQPDPMNVGTHVRDRVVQGFLEDLARVHGAGYAAFFCFERPAAQDQNIEKSGLKAGPPAEWPRGNEELGYGTKIEKMVEDVARGQRPRYEKNFIIDNKKWFALCLLPLELTDNSTGVLVLGFAPPMDFSDNFKRGLESHAPQWVNKLSLNRMILLKRFSTLMRMFRDGIAIAGKKAAEAGPDENPMEIFIKEVLKSSVTFLDSRAGIMTLMISSETGPKRLLRYWCHGRDKMLLGKPLGHEFLDWEFAGPCIEAYKEDKVRVIDDKERRIHAPDILDRLKNEMALMLESGREGDAEKLESLTKIYKGEGEACSLLTFPISRLGSGSEYAYESRRSDAKSAIQGTFCIVLPGEHYFDGIYKKLVRELGRLMAENFAVVRQIQENREFEKHNAHADNRLKQFERAKTADEVIGDFLKGLGTKPPSVDQETAKIKDYWGLADDAVIWTLSLNKSEMVARSARGKGREILRQASRNLDLMRPDAHPYFKKETIDWKTKALHPPKLEGEFRLWTFPLEMKKGDKSELPLLTAYLALTDKKWLVSFPIIDPANRIFGLVDLLRDKPLTLEEDAVLGKVLRRLSRRLCITVDRVTLMKTQAISERLFKEAKEHIGQFNIFDAYKGIAQILKEEFSCEQCDLFLENHGDMLLYTSTSSGASTTDTKQKRAEAWIKNDDTGKEALGTCMKSGHPRILHEWNKNVPREHISPALRKFLKDCHYPERMILPLRKEGELDSTQVIGMVQLHDPKEHEDNSRSLLTNTRFTAEDYRLGRTVAPALRRILRFVQLGEQQIWLFNEMGHSLGQPLQVMRSAINRIWKHGRAGKEPDETLDILGKINNGFEYVREAITQWDYFTETSRHQNYLFFEKADISAIIKECCDFMAEYARNRNIRVDYSGVNFINNVPLVRTWFRKAFFNLLSNAIKYSGGGHNVKTTAAESGNIITIEVKNWGVGIPKEDLDNIFKPYFRSQVPNAMGQRPGAGIGLVLVKYSVENIHGGNIIVESFPIPGKLKTWVRGKEILEDVIHETVFQITLNRGTLNSLKASNPSQERQGP